MSAVMRAAAFIEQAGVPVVAVGADHFERLGRSIARMMDVPSVPIVSYPGVPLSDTFGDFHRKVTELVAPAVVTALITDPVGPGPIDEGAPPASERGMKDVVFSGSLEEVHTHFLERMWTDGLPIVPPTVDRVEAFLRYTDRDVHEVLGILLPARNDCTVWNVAVNGVMAGCAPEHMPVLLAAVECIADPRWRIEDAASTVGWEPMIILSGPEARHLDFNSETGVLRVGRRANTSVGRFLRLYMRNVAGLLPGTTDQGAISGTFHVALAENDDYVRDALGWPTYREDHGYGVDDTVVGVQSIVSEGAPIYSTGDTALEQMQFITRGLHDAMSMWAGKAAVGGPVFPLLVVGPAVAHAFKDFGWTKDRIREHLWENMWERAADVENSLAATAGRWRLTERWENDNRAMARYFRDAAEPMVRVVLEPEDIQIVVAGNPGRNQCRAYLQLGHIGMPLIRPVARASQPGA